MVGRGLFGELPEQTEPEADAVSGGAPRLREPKRDQIELRAVDIDSLIGQDHPARVMWSYVEGLELSELEDRVKARGEQAWPSGAFAAVAAGALAVRHERRGWKRAGVGPALRPP